MTESLSLRFTTYIDRSILFFRKITKLEQSDLRDRNTIFSRLKSPFNRDTTSFIRKTKTLAKFCARRDHRRFSKNLEIARIDRWISDRRTIRSIPASDASSRPSSEERRAYSRSRTRSRESPPDRLARTSTRDDDENHPVLRTRGPTIARDARALAARELTATPGRVRGQPVRGSGWLSRVARKGWLYDGEREREWEMRRMRKRDGDEWDRDTLTHKPCKRKGWRARNTESSFDILRECWRQSRGKGDLSPFIWVSGFARPWPASRWYFVIINRRYINYDRKSVNYHL